MQWRKNGTVVKISGTENQQKLEPKKWLKRKQKCSEKTGWLEKQIQESPNLSHEKKQ